MEMQQYTETNDNNNTEPQLLWDTAKAVLRGKYIIIQAYLKKGGTIPNEWSNVTTIETGKRRTNEA